MSPMFFVIITVLIALACGALATFFVDLSAGIAAFFSCILIALCIAFGLGVSDHNSEVVATREAIEERYDVDFSTGSFRFSEATFVKDGDLYTCTITGERDEARMFCDEPPRIEYATR